MIFSQVPASGFFESAGNFTATAVMIGVFAWLITQYLPKLFVAYQTSLDKQREDFKDELQEGRNHSTEMHKNTHEKLGGLTSAIEGLVLHVKKDCPKYPKNPKED